MFVGVDQSLNHTGVCVLSDAGKMITCTLIEPSKLTGPRRLMFLRDALGEVFQGMRFTVGVLEGYSFGSINRKFDLGEVGSIVKLALLDHADALYVAAPKQLKRFVTSNGSATKLDVMHAIQSQWQVKFDNDNLADAYGLAQIARELHAPRTLKRHQLDVLHDLRGTKQLPEKPKRVKRTRAFKDAL